MFNIKGQGKWTLEVVGIPYFFLTKLNPGRISRFFSPKLCLDMPHIVTLRDWLYIIYLEKL